MGQSFSLVAMTSREPFLSAEAVAEVLGVSTDDLYAWLQFGRSLGVRFELLPLLPLAYEALAGSDRLPVRNPLLRERLVLTPEGVDGIDTDDPDEHARIDRYWEAVAFAALTRDDRALRRFQGTSVGGVELEADVARLAEWAEAAVARGEVG